MFNGKKLARGAKSPFMPNALRCGERVNFRSHDPERFCEINPHYLAIHAALAQVLHASGAGEAIDKILRDWEKLPVLSEDGADAQWLSDRLSLIKAC